MSRAQDRTPMRRAGRAPRWPLAAVAVAGLLLAAPPAAADDTPSTDPTPSPTSTAPADPGGTVVAAVPSVTVHDDASCQGPGTGTVTGAFSVGLSGLIGGPLAAVTVRSDSLVAASAVAMLDAQGSGCADLPAVDAGSYVVTASIGDVLASASIEVPAPPEPPTASAPEPAPLPEPTQVEPPAPTVAPTEPQPTGSAPVEPTSAAQVPPAAPQPVPATSESATLLPPPAPSTASQQSDDPARPAGASTDPAPRVTAPAQVSPAPPLAAASSPGPTATAFLDSTATAAGRVVAVLASSERPAAITIAGFVVFEILGASLLVAFVVLVLARAPRRKG